MSDAIWKFPLTREDVQIVPMPIYAKILHAGILSDGQICLWAKVSPVLAKGHNYVQHHIRIFGTGHDIPNSISDHLKHLGTVIEPLEGIDLVWHVFEVAEP